LTMTGDLSTCKSKRTLIQLLTINSDTVLRAESLEKELNKARKHAAMMQSKLDGAFAQYHNEVQEM
jgi:hypothetical protein